MAIPFLPGDPLTVRQIRELDILAIEHVGIPGLILMENAGRTIAEFVYALLANPTRAQVVILAGGGNNGGDGFVVARQLDNAGVRAATILAIDPSRLRGDAATNFRILQRMECTLLDASSGITPPTGAPSGGQTNEVSTAVRRAVTEADVIVDGLLGTGASGPPRGPMAELIHLANAATKAQRIAIDIPSGLSADTGEAHDPCFRADATITLAATKLGFAAPAARAVLGRVIAVDVGIPRRLVPGGRQL